MRKEFLQKQWKVDIIKRRIALKGSRAEKANSETAIVEKEQALMKLRGIFRFCSDLGSQKVLRSNLLWCGNVKSVMRRAWVIDSRRLHNPVSGEINPALIHRRLRRNDSDDLGKPKQTPSMVQFLYTSLNWFSLISLRLGSIVPSDSLTHSLKPNVLLDSSFHYGLFPFFLLESANNTEIIIKLLLLFPSPHDVTKNNFGETPLMFL